MFSSKESCHSATGQPSRQKEKYNYSNTLMDKYIDPNGCT